MVDVYGKLAGKYTVCPIHRHASPVKDTSSLIPPGKTPRMHKVGMLLVYRIPFTNCSKHQSHQLSICFYSSHSEYDPISWKIQSTLISNVHLMNLFAHGKDEGTYIYLPHGRWIGKYVTYMWMLMVSHQPSTILRERITTINNINNKKKHKNKQPTNQQKNKQTNKQTKTSQTQLTKPPMTSPTPVDRGNTINDFHDPQRCWNLPFLGASHVPGVVFFFPSYKHHLR